MSDFDIEESPSDVASRLDQLVKDAEAYFNPPSMYEFRGLYFVGGLGGSGSTPESEAEEARLEKLQQHILEISERAAEGMARYGICTKSVFTLMHYVEKEDLAWGKEHWPIVKVELQDSAIQLRQSLKEIGDNLEAGGKPSKGKRPRGKQSKDTGGKLKAAARCEIVKEYVKNEYWSGTLKQLRKALKKDKGLDVSTATLSRYLKGTGARGKPRRAAQVPGRRTDEREAVAPDAGPDDLSGCDSYTLPDEDVS